MSFIQNETNIPRDRILELVRKKQISFEIINGSKHYDLNEINKVLKYNLSLALKKYKINKSNNSDLCNRIILWCGGMALGFKNAACV